MDPMGGYIYRILIRQVMSIVNQLTNFIRKIRQRARREEHHASSYGQLLDVKRFKGKKQTNPVENNTKEPVDRNKYTI
ncbi:hypothetical protein TNCV_2537161 [Trichonephila clavipes]|nr:hypothetical protein TNCV_2537161 [Trichonephila clavipes]